MIAPAEVSGEALAEWRTFQQIVLLALWLAFMVASA